MRWAAESLVDTPTEWAGSLVAPAVVMRTSSIRLPLPSRSVALVFPLIPLLHRRRGAPIYGKRVAVTIRLVRAENWAKLALELIAHWLPGIPARRTEPTEPLISENNAGHKGFSLAPLLSRCQRRAR
eukprot:scaffold1130_cov195-Pinguiococcus_pyrenoidosus.AAC.23